MMHYFLTEWRYFVFIFIVTEEVMVFISLDVGGLQSLSDYIAEDYYMCKEFYKR